MLSATLANDQCAMSACDTLQKKFTNVDLHLESAHQYDHTIHHLMINMANTRLDMEKQFQHLKDAPLDEYLSRICDIATQLREKGIKVFL